MMLTLYLSVIVDADKLVLLSFFLNMGQPGQFKFYTY